MARLFEACAGAQPGSILCAFDILLIAEYMTEEEVSNQAVIYLPFRG